MDVNLEELDRVLNQAREAPLSESDHDKLKSALHALAGMLAKPRTSEKTSAVVEQPEVPPPAETMPSKGHGRNSAKAYTSATKAAVPHPGLHAGNACPGCQKGISVPAERTADPGAHRRPSAAGGNRV